MPLPSIYSTIPDDRSFRRSVRPIAPVVVALVDRNLTAAWFERAGNSLTLMCGLRPKWALVGLRIDEVEGAPAEAVEAPELFAFVASRNSVDGRELLRYLAPHEQVRCGRIGLMDQTQWRFGEAGPTEDFEALPVFCYASLSARLIPEQLRDKPDFYVFKASDIGFQRFLEKIGFVTDFPSARPATRCSFPCARDTGRRAGGCRREPERPARLACPLFKSGRSAPHCGEAGSGSPVGYTRRTVEGARACLGKSCGTCSAGNRSSRASI